MLTVSFKVKRKQVAARYKDLIDAMYTAKNPDKPE